MKTKKLFDLKSYFTWGRYCTFEEYHIHVKYLQAQVIFLIAFETIQKPTSVAIIFYMYISSLPRLFWGAFDTTHFISCFILGCTSANGK